MKAMSGYLETKTLRNFIAVATTGSISKAAEVCFVSQPSLSLQMRNLEEFLQVQLFERTSKGVVLTTAGEILLRHAHRVLFQIQEAVNEVKGTELVPQGTVSIGMPLSIAKFITEPLIDHSKKLFPSVFIQILEVGSAYVPDMLAKGEIDLGITFKLAEQKGLISEKIMTERIGILVSDKLVKENPKIGVQFFRNNPSLPFIVPPKNHGLRDVISIIEKKYDIELNVIAEINTISLLIDLSLKGVCATILSYSSIVNYKNDKGIHVIEIDDLDIQRNVYMCTSSITKDSLAVNAIRGLIMSLARQLIDLKG